MALKPHQRVIAEDINFKCNNVAPKGVLLVYSSTAGQVERPPLNNVGTASPSGKKVAGVLMIDVVNKNLPSKFILTGDPVGTVDGVRNFSKLETHVSGVVRLMKVGELLTNNVDNEAFAAGDKLYITNSGAFSKTQDSANHERVGTALAAKDSDGYLKVWVNIT